MGIKGGIARKLLKEKTGNPEPPGSFDVDVLLFLDTYSVRHPCPDSGAREGGRQAHGGPCF